METPSLALDAKLPLTPWVPSFARCFPCLSRPGTHLLSEDGNRNPLVLSHLLFMMKEG